MNSIADGLGMGTGYTLLLIFMGVFRELFGTGKLIMFGTQLLALPAAFDPPRIIIMFPGAFLTFGFIMAFTNRIISKGAK